MLELLNRWSPSGLPLESEAEVAMSRILEDGPGTGARAIFARANDWRGALKAVADDPDAIARSKLIVFPQASVNQYRADFLVVCAKVQPGIQLSTLFLFGFFVECDGRIGHAETAEQVRNDRKREQAIRRQTGMGVLRFSGAEVMYQPNEVQLVISAQVEAMSALREQGEAVKSEASTVLNSVSRMAAHRALRNDYTLRNSLRSQFEPYDPSDPFGDWEFSAEVQTNACWDEFLSLRLDVARLRHAVARARVAVPPVAEPEPDGALRPFKEVLMSTIESVYVTFSQQYVP